VRRGSQDRRRRPQLRCVAAEILEALAPVLSKDRKPPPPAKDRR